MRFTPSYFITILISLFLIACHSESQPVTAKTYNGKFHETPLQAQVPQLVYDTVGPANRDIIDQLDAFYRAQARAGFNGSVLVGYNGKIIYERYLGLSNRELRIPLGPTSSSQLASVSKTFTGAAILYLAERKYLNINDPVQLYIRDFPYSNVTLKMLLNHRSGIPDYTKWLPTYHHDTRTPVTNEFVVATMGKHKPRLEFRPNTRFKYSNTNYVLLARVVEKVTEMSFSTFMNRFVFEPLGMTNTFVYDPTDPLPNNAAISYRNNWVREPDMFADGVTGDKGIYSTARDMYRWDQSFYQNKLLSNETLELAYGPCSFEKPGIKNYGLGWRMLCYPNGNKVIYHNGWWHGNNTSFYRFIKDNMTIIVLGNKFTNAVYRQAPVIYSIVKGVPVGSGFDTEE